MLVVWQWKHQFVMGHFKGWTIVTPAGVRAAGRWKAGAAPQYQAFVPVGAWV